MDPSEFKKYANMRIDLAKEAYDIDLGFNEKSILKLDDLIQNVLDVFEKDDNLTLSADHLNGLVLLNGSFLGEAIRETLGGEWEETKQSWAIKISNISVGNVSIRVFGKVQKRLLNGMEDSISYYYKSVKKMLENNFKDIIK